MHDQLKASEKYARMCFLERHEDHTSTTLAEKISNRIAKRFLVRFAFNHLRQLRKQLG